MHSDWAANGSSATKIRRGINTRAVPVEQRLSRGPNQTRSTTKCGSLDTAFQLFTMGGLYAHQDGKDVGSVQIICIESKKGKKRKR